MWRVIGALACVAAALCAAPARAVAAPTDGQLLAIARAASGDRLVALNPDGSGLRTILSGGRLSSPSWSPDGNRVLVEDGHRVEILDVASGALSTVIDEADVAAPTWAPDGTRIALLRGSSVVTMRTDGSDARAVPVPFAGPISWVDWSPDGARLAYGSSAALRTVGLDGSGDRGLVSATMLGEPAWSPDATRLVYADGGRLRVIRADGSAAPVDLTTGETPDWSPDGSEIVYAYGAGLRATTADGAATRAVAAPTDAQTVLTEPDWQPCVAGVTLSCVSPAPPSCPDAAVTTTVDQPVVLPLGGCTDPAGRRLTVAVVSGPVHGTLSGDWYVPAPGWTGQDMVVYRAGNGYALSALAHIAIAVAAPAGARAPRPAPYLSALAAPRLDARGRGTLRVSCDQDCTITLRLVVRLRTHHTITGRALTRTLPAGRALAFQLRAPPRRRVYSAWVTGTAANPAGAKRSFKIPVALR
jgi:dipeptidyl aminopeptidase/acylaminoacyl peptidase